MIICSLNITAVLALYLKKQGPQPYFVIMGEIIMFVLCVSVRVFALAPFAENCPVYLLLY